MIKKWRITAQSCDYETTEEASRTTNTAKWGIGTFNTLYKDTTCAWEQEQY